MHGALLDGESGVFVGRIDAEAKNVGCLQSLSFVVLFQPFFWSRFSGLLRLHRSLHVKTLSTLFDSIEIPTKLYGSPQNLFCMVLPDLYF